MKLTRNQMKLIAIIAMTLDHIAAMFMVPSSTIYFIFRFVGRLTAPVMSYFIAEGFRYTHDRKKYAERLLIFAGISQIPFMLAFDTYTLNVMFTLYISLRILEAEEERDRYKKNFRMFILFFASLFCDWIIFIPIWVLIFYENKNRPGRRDKLFALVGIMDVALVCLEQLSVGGSAAGALYNMGFLLFLPVLHMYDGSKGKRSFLMKWGYYVYYPLHLLILFGTKKAF